VVPVVASWLVLRETPRRPARFDLAGAVALAAGLGPLLLAVDRIPEWGFLAGSTLGCLALGGVGLAAFVAIERRVAAPLVPLAFLRSRATSSTLLASGLSNGAYMGAFFLASLMMVRQFGYTLTGAVPILSIRPALFAAASPLGGWLTGRAGSRVAAVAGCAVLGGGLAGLALGSAIGSLAVVIVVGFLLQGIGFGLLRPAISTALANSVDQADLGMAGAAERLSGQLGVAFGITVVATVYAGEVDRFAPAFVVAALFAVLASLLALGLRTLADGWELDAQAAVSTAKARQSAA
jgi:MFS family permease